MKHSGFTLVELILVIVILGIVSVGTVHISVLVRKFMHKRLNVMKSYHKRVFYKLA